MDELSDQDQCDMAGLVAAERMKCPSGHPLSLSLRGDLTLLVEDDVCEWCRALANVQHAQAKRMPEHAMAGRLYAVRPKGGVPRDQ